jgi:hypothetical protein
VLGPALGTLKYSEDELEILQIKLFVFEVQNYNKCNNAWLIFALHYGDMIDPVNSLLSDGEI